MIIIGFYSSCGAKFSEFLTHTCMTQLKTPTSRRQTSLILAILAQLFRSHFKSANQGFNF